MLIIPYDLIVTMKKITFRYYVKSQPKVLIIELVQQKKSNINFSKVNTEFCLNLHYNGYGSYLYSNETKIFKSEAKDNISWYNCWLESVSKDFIKDQRIEIPFNGTVHEFLVDNSSI